MAVCCIFFILTVHTQKWSKHVSQNCSFKWFNKKWQEEMESSPEDVAFIDIFWLDFCLWLVFFFCQWMWMSALDLLCAAYHTIWLRCIEWHLNGNSYTHYFSSTGSVMPGASFSPLSSFLLSTPQWHWIAAIWQTRPVHLENGRCPKSFHYTS